MDGLTARRVPWLACTLLLLVALTSVQAQLLYDREWPVIGYSTGSPRDPVTRLQQQIDGGEVTLAFESGRGYLASLLRQLNIPVSSQTLVFTKTSVQIAQISPATPRAVYFNDDVAVAFEQGGQFLEISAVDPNLGLNFYTLEQDLATAQSFHRETYLCLRCHDSYSMTGGGVPRHIMGATLPDAEGRPISHEGWYLTDDRTPIERRWGGWYVTGTHGDQRHMGNLILGDVTEAARPDLTRGANVTDLSSLVDTAPYLSRHSDLVALMTLEHQVHVQNEIIRVNYHTRTALEEDRATAELIETLTEPLVRALLFVEEASIGSPMQGTSSFAVDFVARGPSDGRGRSLRQFDLTERLFRYPLSYLIYSDAFDALPDVTKAYVYRRLREVLGGEDRSEAFARISDEDGRAVLEILRATKPDFFSDR